MIGGMLNLDFDDFRRVPFSNASLELSTGDLLEVEWVEKSDRPLRVSFSDMSIRLAIVQTSNDYKASDLRKIDIFRSKVLPLTRSVRYDLLDIDRSNLNRMQTDEERYEMTKKRSYRGVDEVPLSQKVRSFLREAQINHRRFFRSEELDVLPRLLDRLSNDHPKVTTESLIERLRSIEERVDEYDRFGLYVDNEQLSSLSTLVSGERTFSPAQLSLIETYVESQEGIEKARELIATRLTQFEGIMDQFLIGKSVKVDRRTGLIIESSNGLLKENQLSSGEYHFLYMMVTALLCQRIGTVIAIDEPELSLHISWQRKLVSALSKCAAGASPLFLFATHSLAISAEHPNNVVRLSAVD